MSAFPSSMMHIPTFARQQQTWSEAEGSHDWYSSERASSWRLSQSEASDGPQPDDQYLTWDAALSNRPPVYVARIGENVGPFGVPVP